MRLECPNLVYWILQKLQDMSTMCLVRQFIEAFWHPFYWLPPNITWKDLEARPDIVFPDHRHLLSPVACAVIVLITRWFLEKHLISRIGLRLGVKIKHHKRVPKNSTLEKAFIREKKCVKPSQITALSKQLDWSERQVERWLRLRRVQDKPTALSKFCESFWRFMYYTGAFVFGVYVLWNKPWLWNIHECWIGYPFQSIDDDVWWYYMISMTFYWSLMFSHYFDTKRKDFWQMFTHHCATIFLLSSSWVCNHVRIGTLVLLIHDLADAVMEAAKLAKYTNHMDACNVLFITFAATWMVTRLGFYPFWILYNAAFDAPKVLSYSFPYFVNSFFLGLLFFLHVYWSYLIFCIIFKCVEGETLDDIRSSSDGGQEDTGIGEGDSANVRGSVTTKGSKPVKADPGGDVTAKKTK